MRISLKVIPKSKRQAAKLDGNVIKVWLHSTPEGGKANDELVRTLAEIFSVTKNRVIIVSGFSSRTKTVDILGVEDLGQIFPKDGTEISV